MKHLTYGKFITLEGCEGVGKTTQTQLLMQYVKAHNIDAIFTREPGGTFISEKIRGVILDPDCKGMDDVTELFLYAAARRQHTQEVILPALKKGKWVFCDRYSDSTLAYQGYARGLDKDTVRQINAYAQGEVTVDCTVFLDVCPLEGFKRLDTRGYKDRLELESMDFHQAVYQGFKAIAALEPNRVLSIKNGTAQEVHAAIIQGLTHKGIV